METKYTNLSQDDEQGIRYVKKDYNTDPAKGLIHGLQKDAIQNSVGAANSKKLKDWKVVFELLTINGKDALSFTDEGTLGLVGDIILQSEIMERKSKGELGSQEHLSRFRTVFVSGDNSGPGSYGRGKLVFQACSKTYTILCDTLRKTDGKYIAFKRTINNLQLQESQMFLDNEAEAFIKSQTGGALKKLDKEGTRITIIDLDPLPQTHGLSIKDSFLRSFADDQPDDECELSFDKMIQETWWEMITKHDARIFLKHNQREMLVQISEPLKSILNNKDKEKGWRVYEKHDISIDIDGTKHIIKQLRFVVSPNGESLPSNFQTIFTQRKKMKIGAINKGIFPNKQIIKNFCGFLIFDKDLDEIILEPENLTHYGFQNMNYTVLKKIRAEIQKHLNNFHKQLGLGATEDDGILSKTLNDTLKEINQQAKELGLLTAIGLGKKRKNFDIKFLELNLPLPNSFRVEYEDNIGPIKCQITNLTKQKYSGKIVAQLEQSQQGQIHKQRLLEDIIDLLPNESMEIFISEFSVSKDFFYGQAVMLKIEIPDENCKNTRFLWLGLDPPVPEDNFPIKLKTFEIDFPREGTRRVEIGEILKDLNIKIFNEWPNNFKAVISININRIKYENKELLKALEETVIIGPGIDKDFSIDEMPISDEIFGFFEGTALKHEFRTCQLVFDIIASEPYPELLIQKGQKLMRSKKVDFFIGIDDPGNSIFKYTKDINDPKDPRRSYYEEIEAGGYGFILNSGHTHYKKLKDAGCPNDIIGLYIKEEMLKSAYSICLLENTYGGIFDEYSKVSGDNLSYSDGFHGDAPKHDTIGLFNELMGKALQSIN